MESDTRSISKDDTSLLTRVFSAADRPNSSIVSSGVFNLVPFSERGSFLTATYQNKDAAGKWFFCEWMEICRNSPGNVQFCNHHLKKDEG